MQCSFSFIPYFIEWRRNWTKLPRRAASPQSSKELIEFQLKKANLAELAHSHPLSTATAPVHASFASLLISASSTVGILSSISFSKAIRAIAAWTSFYLSTHQWLYWRPEWESKKLEETNNKEKIAWNGNTIDLEWRVIEYSNALRESKRICRNKPS